MTGDYFLRQTKDTAQDYMVAGIRTIRGRLVVPVFAVAPERYSPESITGIPGPDPMRKRLDFAGLRACSWRQTRMRPAPIAHSSPQWVTDSSSAAGSRFSAGPICASAATTSMIRVQTFMAISLCAQLMNYRRPSNRPKASQKAVKANSGTTITIGTASSHAKVRSKTAPPTKSCPTAAASKQMIHARITTAVQRARGADTESLGALSPSPPKRRASAIALFRLGSWFAMNTSRRMHRTQAHYRTTAGACALVQS